MTFKEIRLLFWDSFPKFKPHYRKSYTQNQYNTDIRTTFVNYIDSLRKDEHITEKQANKITL